MSSSKKRDFAAGVYPSEAQDPISPPLHTVYEVGGPLISSANR